MRRLETARLIFLVNFILFAVFALSSVVGASDTQEVTLLYTGQTHAMLYPCDCPGEPDGGIARRASLVKKLKQRFPQALLLDSGGFFAGGILDQYSLGEEPDKQRTLINLRAMDLMQYDAVAIGAEEFNFGQEFLRKNTGNSKIAFLSCNIQPQGNFLPYTIKQIGSLKVGILGVSTAAVMPKIEGLTLLTPKVAVAQAVGKLKEKDCDLIILLSTLPENEELDLVDNIQEIDALVTYNIAKSADESTSVVPSSVRGRTLILRPSWQGRRLGKASLTVKDKRIVRHKIEELRLSEEVIDDPGVLAFLPGCFSDKDCSKSGFEGQCQNPGTLSARCNFFALKEVNLLVVSTKSCVTCDTEKAVERIKQWFPDLVVSYLYHPQARAQKLIRDLGIEALPAYLLGKEIEETKAFAQLKLDKHSEKKGDFYILHPRLVGLTYLLNREKIKGKLDLFISFYSPKCRELLDMVKVFNPEVHFLAREEAGSFEALRGNLEVEEYLRAVCVQKYHPQAYWNYIICRTEKFNSSWWEDCAFGLDAQKIKSCAQSAEGRGLLKENTRLNKELGILFGPTYLLHNQEIFVSQGLPSQDELKEIINK